MTSDNFTQAGLYAIYYRNKSKQYLNLKITFIKISGYLLPQGWKHDQINTV